MTHENKYKVLTIRFNMERENEKVFYEALKNLSEALGLPISQCFKSMLTFDQTLTRSLESALELAKTLQGGEDDEEGL